MEEEGEGLYSFRVYNMSDTCKVYLQFYVV